MTYKTSNARAAKLTVAVFFMCGLLVTALRAEGRNWTLPDDCGQGIRFRVGSDDAHYVTATIDGTVLLNFKNDGSDRPPCSNPIGITVYTGQEPFYKNLAPGEQWHVTVPVRSGESFSVTIKNGYCSENAGYNWTCTLYEMEMNIYQN